jgi:hypothetical protein
MQDFSVDQIELRKRLDAMNARREAAALAQKEKSRADRKAGRLTQGVINGLRAYTIPQLLRAKKLCDKFIWDQRHAPLDEDCSEDRRSFLKSYCPSHTVTSGSGLRSYAALRRPRRFMLTGRTGTATEEMARWCSGEPLEKRMFASCLGK